MKLIQAIIRNGKTTLFGLLAFVAALGSIAAQIHVSLKSGDYASLLSMDAQFAELLATGGLLFAAIANIFSRDADKSTEDSTK
jgi:hypothetical protein